MNPSRIKSAITFIVITIIFTFVFYGGYRYSSGVYHIQMNFVTRHVTNLQPKGHRYEHLVSGISPEFKKQIYSVIKKCVTTPSVSDYYHLMNNKILFGPEVTSKQWSIATDYVEGMCTDMAMDNVYNTKGFGDMMGFHDVLITLNYTISPDWPEKTN